jgi:hypothetical protein
MQNSPYDRTVPHTHFYKHSKLQMNNPISFGSSSTSASSLYYPRISPEVINRFIEDYNHDAKPSLFLSTSSSIPSPSVLSPSYHKSFLPSSSNKHHSYRSFTLRMDHRSIQRFHIILDSPCSSDLIQSIGDLRIVGPGEADSSSLSFPPTVYKIDAETRAQWLALLPKLSKLTSLETLQIERLYWEDLELHSPASCILRFPNLHVLDISCVQARSFSNIFRTVSCCSRLSSLGIVDVTWSHELSSPDFMSTPEPTPRLPTPSLRHLTLTRCPKADVLDWLLASGHFDLETSVCFEAIRNEECVAVARYLRALGDSLTALSLEFAHDSPLSDSLGWVNNGTECGSEQCLGMSPNDDYLRNIINLGYNSAFHPLLTDSLPHRTESSGISKSITYLLSHIISSCLLSLVSLPLHLR